MSDFILILSTQLSGAVKKIAEQLKNMDYKTILVSDIKADPNRSTCDEYIYFDWESGQLSELLNKISTINTQPKFVITILEPLMKWQAMISKCLGCYYSDMDAAAQLADKHQFRKLINSIKFYSAPLNKIDINEVSFFPCILKPAENTGGSRNVITCHNKKQLSSAIKSLIQISQDLNEKYIIEEYVEGIEYTMDGYIDGGKFHNCLITEKLDFDYINNQDGNHIITPPIHLTEKATKAISDQINAIINILHINRMWLHIEFRVNQNKAVIIEVNPRFGGRMYATAIKYLSGIDPLKKLICNNIQLREATMAPIYNENSYTYLLFVTFKAIDGKLKSYTPLPLLKQPQHFIDGFVIPNFECAKYLRENIFAEFLIGGNTLSELFAIESEIRTAFYYEFN